MKFLRQIHRCNPALLYFVILWVCVCVQIMIFSSVCNLLGLRMKFIFLADALDAAVVLLPFWLLPRRWSWAILILTSLNTIYIIACCMYYQVYHCIMPVASLLYFNNAGSTLAGSVVSLWGWRESFLLLAGLVPVAAWIWWPGKEIRCDGGCMPRPLRLCMLAAGVVCWLGSQTLYIMKNERLSNKFGQSLFIV